MARLRSNPADRERLLQQERKRLEIQIARQRGASRKLVEKIQFCSICAALTTHAGDDGRFACLQCARATQNRDPIPASGPARRTEAERGSIPAYCGAMTMVGEDPTTGRAQYKRMWCNTYDCARCGPKRYRRARKAISAAAQKHSLTKFWTLTLDPKKLDGALGVKGQIKYLRESWRKLRVSLSRKCGHSVEFICVVELQKSGLPHLHVLMAEWIRQEWMREAWTAVGGGQMVWVEAVTIKRVAAYIAKYVTKDRLSTVPPSVRRFSASKGIEFFGRIRPTEERRWFVARIPIDLLRARLLLVDSEAFIQEPATQEPILVKFVAELLAMALDFRRFRCGLSG